MIRIPRPFCHAIVTAVLGFLMLLAALPAHADEVSSLRTALQRASLQDWAGAADLAEGPLSQDLMEWLRLRSGDGKLGDYEEFLSRRADWPGLALLREKGEEAVARSTDPDRVLAYFAANKPRLPVGSLALVKAYLALGRPGDAETESIRAWTGLEFTATEETALLALMPDALSVAHEVRLDRVLWADRVAEAMRMLPRVSADWRKLAEARMALRAMAGNASALVDTVPKSLAGDAGLAFERFLWRMKKDRTADATALILERSESAASLGNASIWADRRATLDFMPGSDVPVIRQPFAAGDPLPFWALGQKADQHHLYDLHNDPTEAENRVGHVQERRMQELLRVALKSISAPSDQFERLGIA